jgi:hypothetical protein
MIRILLLIFLIYLFYRFLAWFRDIPKKSSPSARNKSRPAPAKKPVIDEMKACAQCGTYQPARSAFQKNGLYFCNYECHEAYQHGRKP